MGLDWVKRKNTMNETRSIMLLISPNSNTIYDIATKPTIIYKQNNEMIDTAYIQ